MAAALKIILILIANVVAGIGCFALILGRELVKVTRTAHDRIGTGLARLYARKGWL